LFGAFLTTAGPEPHAVQSIRGEPGSAKNRQALASPYYPAIPQDLHDPQIRQIDFRVSKNTRHAPPFRFGGARARISQRIFKDHPHYPDILSLRQDCPSLASVSGTCSLLNGIRAIATGSFCRNQPINTSHHGLSPRYPCACSSLRSIVTLTPPAAPPCVHASCWPRGGYIGSMGCRLATCQKGLAQKKSGVRSGNPVSRKSGVRKSGRKSGEEIRCQCIILARKDELTSDYAPKR